MSSEQSSKLWWLEHMETTITKKSKNGEEYREIMNDRTASKTEVHRGVDKRRWLGPPSFPLTEPGRIVFSVTTSHQKTAPDDLVNETSSSCQSIWWKNYEDTI